MRRIILPIIILSLFSIPASPQAQISPVKQRFDVNSAPLRNHSFEMDAPYSLSGVMTAYSYDSVRALTEINNPNFADAYPWISADGLRLYYTKGSATGNYLAFTSRPDTNSFFTKPVLSSISVPNAFSFWLTSDELGMYFTDGSNIYCTNRTSTSLPFTTPVRISLSGTTYSFISGESLNTAQNQLYLFSLDKDRILQFSRTSDTSFTYARTLPAPSGYLIDVGQLSKDDLTIFFGASSYGGNQILIYQMTRATPTDSFELSTFQQIKGINNLKTYFNGQPSMSNHLQWVVFVGAVAGLWELTDLLLAHRGSVSSVFNPADNQISSSAYPNPASEYLFIRCKTAFSTPITLSVFSSVGALVYEDFINPSADKIRVDTRALKAGLYIYRLSQEADNTTVCGTGRFAVLH